jgi:hypothetical protein
MGSTWRSGFVTRYNQRDGVIVRIGLDFDNTIVSYDSLFHKVAVEQGAVPRTLPVSKLEVRNYLRRMGKEDLWTEMQGYVYGARMAEAAAFPGVKEFLRWARSQALDVCIISHKTRHPFIGPKYDLHAAAFCWVDSSLIDGGENLVPRAQVFFELTKEEKLYRIAQAACDYFIDDLPEILLADNFPVRTAPILFDPEASHPNTDRLVRMASWEEILRHFQERC